MTPLLGQADLLARGRHVPLFSGEMHFWRIERDAWEACLRQLRAVGLPIVSTYLSWRRHCLAPGEHDLTGRTDPRLDLPSFLELCGSLGLWVHLKPGPWICAEEPNGGYPDWLVAEHDLQVLDSEGQAVLGYNPPFQSPVPSYLHPKYLDHVRQWLTDVDTCIRDFCYPQGPIVMIQLDNEPSMTFHDQMFEADYNPVNVGVGGLYSRWLLRKYRTIRALNQAHQTDWADFATVEAPRSFTLQRLTELRRYTDWVEFKEWLLVKYIESLREIHLHNGIRGVLFTVNYNKHDPMAVPNDWSRLEQASGLGGFDYYVVPPLEFGELVDIALAVNYSLAVSRLPWAPEMMAGIWKIPGAEEGHPDPKVEDLTYLYFIALAFGLKGMNFYMAVNRESWAHAPIDQWGRLTQTYAAVKKVMELTETLADFPSLHKNQSLAIMYYRPYAREAYIAAGSQTDAEGVPLGRAWRVFKDLYTALVRLNYDPAIFDPSVHPEDVTKYRAILVPSGPYMDIDTQTLLQEFAAGGGTLILWGALPRLDAEMRPRSPLETICKGREPRKKAQSSFSEYRIGKGQILLAQPAHRATGMDPANTVKPGILRTLLRHCDLSPEVEADTSEILTVVQRNDRETVLFVINSGPDRREVTLRFRGVRNSKLQRILPEGMDISISEGEAKVTIRGRTVEVFFIQGSRRDAETRRQGEGVTG